MIFRKSFLALLSVMLVIVFCTGLFHCGIEASTQTREIRYPTQLNVITPNKVNSKSSASGTLPVNVINPDNLLYWISSENEETEQWITFELSDVCPVRKIEITAYDIKDLSNFRIYGSTVDWDAKSKAGNWYNSTALCLRDSDEIEFNGSDNTVIIENFDASTFVKYISIRKKDNSRLSLRGLKIYIDGSSYNNMVDRQNIKELNSGKMSQEDKNLFDNNNETFFNYKDRKTFILDLTYQKRVDAVSFYSRSNANSEIAGVCVFGTNDSTIYESYSSANKELLAVFDKILQYDRSENNNTPENFQNIAYTYSETKYRYIIVEGILGGCELSVLQNSEKPWSPKMSIVQGLEVSSPYENPTFTNLLDNNLDTKWQAKVNNELFAVCVENKQIDAVEIIANSTATAADEYNGFIIGGTNNIDDTPESFLVCPQIRNYNLGDQRGVWRGLIKNDKNYKYLIIKPATSKKLSFSEIRFYKDEAPALSVNSEGTLVTATLNLSKLNTEKGVLLLGVYDTKKSLIDVFINDKPNFDQLTITADKSKYTGTVDIRAYAWDSLTNIKPLCSMQR